MTISVAIKDQRKTYMKYPPRELQSEGYTGLITLSNYESLSAFGNNSKKRAKISVPTVN